MSGDRGEAPCPVCAGQQVLRDVGRPPVTAPDALRAEAETWARADTHDIGRQAAAVRAYLAGWVARGKADEEAVDDLDSYQNDGRLDGFAMAAAAIRRVGGEGA